jgi:Rieske Fe-S protein
VSGAGPLSRVRRRTLALLAGLAACAPAPPPDRRVRIHLASLDAGGRVEIEYAGEPTEVVLGPAGVVARTLLCSHFGCRVEWRPAERRYHCPCHEGLFDADGEPAGGPPNRPLRRVRAEVAGAEVVIGEP